MHTQLPYSHTENVTWFILKYSLSYKYVDFYTHEESACKEYLKFPFHCSLFHTSFQCLNWKILAIGMVRKNLYTFNLV